MISIQDQFLLLILSIHEISFIKYDFSMIRVQHLNWNKKRETHVAITMNGFACQLDILRLIMNPICSSSHCKKALRRHAPSAGGALFRCYSSSACEHHPEVATFFFENDEDFGRVKQSVVKIVDIVNCSQRKFPLWLLFSVQTDAAFRDIEVVLIAGVCRSNRRKCRESRCHISTFGIGGNF